MPKLRWLAVPGRTGGCRRPVRDPSQGVSDTAVAADSHGASSAMSRQSAPCRTPRADIDGFRLRALVAPQEPAKSEEATEGATPRPAHGRRPRRHPLAARFSARRRRYAYRGAKRGADGGEPEQANGNGRDDRDHLPTI